MRHWGSLTWVRRSEIERLRQENQDLKRQYGERVALERRNLKDLETRYNELVDRVEASGLRKVIVQDGHVVVEDA